MFSAILIFYFVIQVSVQLSKGIENDKEVQAESPPRRLDPTTTSKNNSVIDNSNLNNGSCLIGDPNHCRCDPLCHAFRDCCEEIILQQTREYKSSLKQDLGMCISKNYMISKCPKNTGVDASLARDCEYGSPSQSRIKFYLPVYNKETLKLYRNVFCAICNGEDKFTKIDSKFKCRDPQTNVSSISEVIELLDAKKCFFFHEFPESVQRKCGGRIIKSCSVDTSSEVSKTCSQGPAWLSYNKIGVRYKNPACCDCNGVQCFNSFTGLKGFGGRRHFLSYDIIMNFDQWCGKICVLENNDTISFEMRYKEQISHIFGILTRIGCISSFIGLCALIGMYSCLPDLRNFAGLLTLALACTLLLQFIVFAMEPIAAGSLPWCRFTAALLHFLYLSSFVWMALFAMDLICTFYGQGAHVTRRPMVRLAKFSVIAYGLPLGIVVICSFLDAFAFSSLVSPRYGTKICWFNHMWGGIVWFFAPVGMILVFNCCACVACFLHFYRTARDTEQLRGQHFKKKSMFWLCLKITALFGISWILQLISVLCHVHLLTKIVGILNSMHGLFIALCFLLTKKIKHVASESYQRIRISFAENGRSPPSRVSYAVESSTNNACQLKELNESTDKIA